MSQDSGAQYRGLLEAAPDAMVVVNQGGEIVLLNVQAEKQFGYHRDELVGQKVTNIIPAGFAERLVADGLRSAADALAQQIGTGIELTGRRKDGSEFPIEIMLSPLENADGILVTAAIRNISVRKAAEKHLGQMEARYRGLLEAAPDAMVVVNPAGVIVLLNVQAEKRFGYHRDELLGQKVTNIIPEGFAERLIADGTRSAADALAQQIGTGIELIARRKDASEFPIEIMLSPLQSADGILVTAAIRDISVRKAAERHLVQMEQRYRGLLEAAPDAMVVVNQAGEIVLLNVRAENQFGYRRDELLGQKMTNIIPEGFAERLIADALRSVEDARAQQIGTGIELHGRHRNGSTFPIEIMLSPLESAEGILVTAAIRDISVRKKMEEASFGEKERLRLQSAALESTADGVMITECDGTITWVNPAFCRITGFTATEAAGCKPSIFRSSEHDDAFYGQLWRTILDGQVWDGELTNRRKDGQLYLEALTITPVRDSHGAISHFVSVKRDVSHRRRLEEQLRQSQKMEAVGRLAGGVAHDFNNILGVIMGYGEILRRRIPDGDPLREKVAEILKAAERAAALTRQLLAFSRKQVLQPRVLDLNLVVADMEEMLRRLIGEDIALKMSLREPLGSVRADPGQVEQVLMNLVVNARDAMPAAGSLLIETAEVELDASALALHPGARPGPYVMLAVSDTGQGMDRETISRIFEPFFTTKPLGEGTGLGLSTVYGIIEQSGGHVAVYSEKGCGTTFKVYLPRIGATVEPVEAPAAPRPRRAASETILLVEDEPALRAVVRETLVQGGYLVLEAGTPRQALLVAEGHEGSIHAVLTDVVMPEMSGRELAERLSPLRPHAVVVYMSGYTDDAIGHHGLLDPGTLFLQKPFSGDALLWKLHLALAPAGVA